MEDSSTNPYIPQESDRIRQKVYQRQSPLGRIVKRLAISTAVIAVLVGVGLYFIIPKTSVIDQQARTKLANALQPPDQVLKRVSVESTVGFKLNYDNRVYSSYAEVGDSTAGSDNSRALTTGEKYENNELRTVRAYNYVRIFPIESVDTARALAPEPPWLELFATVTDRDLTASQAVPENKGQSKLSLFVKLDMNKRQAKRIADDKTVVTIDATRPVRASVGGVDYQKVRYTTTNDNHRVPNVKYDDCYYSITDYAQPYSICISNVRPTNVSAASLVEEVFNSIIFINPAARAAGASASSQDDIESPLTTITPSYYNDNASLSSIASNQPSVVRIGTLYCTDLNLKYESGETATSLTDACVGNVASGVFISKDGLIATTGHAIRSQKKAAINGYINFAPDRDAMLGRLQRILDYLLKAKIILQSDADYLKTGASIGDQEALAKVENIASVIPDKFITPIKEEYTYAVQPTDKPIVVNRNDSLKPSFAYSDSVLKANYVTSDYNASRSIQEIFGSVMPTVDVGLLRVDGDFPEVPIVASESLKANDKLNTIGYPAYTDSSLMIDKIRNLPVVTVSKVDQAYQKDGTRLIQTDKPVLPGNDGAPVFDGTGQLVGFAVYGLSYCPDQACFGNGTVRSSNELIKLLGDSNIKLVTGNQSATNWRSGVAEFMRANYTASANGFKLAGSQYGYNRWADPLQKLAVAGQGTPSDTSLMNLLQTGMIAGVVVLVIATILLSGLSIIQRRRINGMQVGHYGIAAAVTQPAAPTPVPREVPVAPSGQQITGQPISGAQQYTEQAPGPLPNQTAQPQPQPTQAPQAPIQPDTSLHGSVPPSEDPFYK